MQPIGHTAPVQLTLALDHARKDASETADRRLKEVSQKLEATFLAEMLKHAGVGETPDAFGGGAGEDQFASFLRQAQAEEIAKAGGIGLAQQLYKSMKGHSDAPV